MLGVDWRGDGRERGGYVAFGGVVADTPAAMAGGAVDGQAGSAHASSVAILSREAGDLAMWRGSRLSGSSLRGNVVQMWCKLYVAGLSTLFDLHELWCAILGLNQ
ncbi:predicted protein [Mycolicibacterium canariasense]|uniref:Uncharacterized protein n=1 Tax=Mycolicibacterium canariasense TaxID=228230 RepID=A0A100W8L2_MYCCR|nr:predicted protein [Mycolicibacterium canariasense]